MKNKFQTYAFVGIFIFASSSAFSAGTERQRSDNDDNGDNGACEMVTCMMGEVTGRDGGSACSKPIKDFFSIKKKKHGHFSGSKTSDARKGALGSCKTASSGDISQVIDMFGSVKSLF